MPSSFGNSGKRAQSVSAIWRYQKHTLTISALVIGKANLSELASYKTLNAEGWSAVGGQTVNIYAAHASPGSSSSGSGVAVAAGFCPASVGTDTGKSLLVASTSVTDHFFNQTVLSSSRRSSQRSTASSPPPVSSLKQVSYRSRRTLTLQDRWQRMCTIWLFCWTLCKAKMRKTRGVCNIAPEARKNADGLHQLWVLSVFLLHQRYTTPMGCLRPADD
jgi:hypothetical protein